MKVLFVGDIEGKPGRRAAAKLLGALRSSLEIDFVIVNGENAAGGFGITKPTATNLFDAGADVITLGNHTFAKREAFAQLDQEPRIIRPANYPPGTPGRGWGVFGAGNIEVAVLSLMGRTFMTPIDCPFRTADAALPGLRDKTPIVVVDMHAEATSEKVAMGWYLDGRASAVLGTHTHVQTSDERVLPGGTAYLTDAGMTGVHESVLGITTGVIIERFKTHVPEKLVLAEGEATLQGAVIEIDEETGRASGIRRLSVGESEGILNVEL
ncbi:MAG: TIGR00282 family metallophosphoesterase [Armatimonadetes bacterium]|nr:TIGR00282 family metallophosphoesterase [Armatimonadota bacterium]